MTWHVFCCVTMTGEKLSIHRSIKNKGFYYKYTTTGSTEIYGTMTKNARKLPVTVILVEGNLPELTSQVKKFV